MAILETQALTRRFKTLTAVYPLDLSIEPGEVFGLLGPNGAGKTTTIKMLTTLLPPISGSARGRIRHYPPGYCRAPGNRLRASNDLGGRDASGRENLMVFARLYDIPRRECKERVRTSLAFMRLDDSADKLVRDYSGGMIRRLEIAQSMLHRPTVLFLDEPTVGLDPNARRTVWDHIQELRRNYGMTILLTTHLMEEADSLCDRVAIMHHGKVVAIGMPMELKAGIGGKNKSLDDVFIHFTGEELDSEGGYRETRQARRTARRLPFIHGSLFN